MILKDVLEFLSATDKVSGDGTQGAGRETALPDEKDDR